MECKKTLQLVAGPVTIPADIRALYVAEYGSSDIEDEFFQEYGVLCDRLRRLLLTKNDVVCAEGVQAVKLSTLSMIFPLTLPYPIATGMKP